LQAERPTQKPGGASPRPPRGGAVPEHL